MIGSDLLDVFYASGERERLDDLETTYRQVLKELHHSLKEDMALGKLADFKFRTAGLNEALKELSFIKSAENRGFFLGQIVERLAFLKRIREAESVLKSITRSDVRSRCLSAIAKSYARSEKFRDARLTAVQISDPSNRLSAFAYIIGQIARQRDPALQLWDAEPASFDQIRWEREPESNEEYRRAME